MSAPQVAEARTLHRAGRLGEAARLYQEILRADPGLPEALYGWGVLCMDRGQLPEALAAFDTGVTAAPNNASLWFERGNALLVAQRLDDALESYERAVAIQPDFAEANNNRLAALFTLGRAPRCPPSYIRRTFDAFASHYDETMLSRLGYRGHHHLRQLADAVLPRRMDRWHILDLGCGTGLAGETFKDLAAGGRLDGIDLSPKMLEGARLRGIYGELITGDIETVLAEPGPSYDLILAADTMSYLGDLSRVFAGVAARLVPEGFYLFAVESMPGDGWEQTPRKLFRHSDSYVRRAAAAARLVPVHVAELGGDWARGSRREDATVLHDGRLPVTGLAIALQRAP
jgi:predicted TPR repeat methyltransferase